MFARIITCGIAMTMLTNMASGAENVDTTQMTASASAIENNSKSSVSEKSETKVNYIPQFSGVLRARWEGEFTNDDGFFNRFQVRNARLKVKGDVFRGLSYTVQVDACDNGKFKILDAFATWKFARQWQVKAGQFRVPFGIDCFRGPGDYYFANRSSIGKIMMNMRAVGAQISYTLPKAPLTIEAGVFNASAMGDHNKWHKAMTYATRAKYRISNVTLSASFISAEPNSARMNMIDGCISWSADRWIIESEYQHKHYTKKAFKSVNSWHIFSSYGIPLNSKLFNELSFQARFDQMTDHSSGVKNDEGLLQVDDPARRRITIGSTISVIKKPLAAHVRINYEKYFYDKGVKPPKGVDDKILAELVIKF